MPHKIETGQYALDFRYRVIAFYILLHFQLNKDLKCEIAFVAFVLYTADNEGNLG